MPNIFIVMKIIITESQFGRISKEIGEIGYNPQREYPSKDLIDIYAEDIPKYGKPLNIHLDIPYENVIYQPKNEEFILLAYHNDKPVMLCIFFIEKNSIEIEGIFANEVIRGQEIGIKTYEQIAKKFGLPISSGGSQTKYSRYGIWEKLIKKYPDNITVVDDYGGKERPLEDVGIDTVYSDVRYRLKLYF